MNDKGAFVEIKNGEKNIKENFADDLIIFSPKRVTIQPGSSQVIRLLLKKTPNLASQEYRSHLLITQEESKNNSSQDVKERKKISVTLNALIATSIPVIVNVGEKNSKIEIADVVNKGDELLVRIKRSGNSTIYGDLVVNSDSGKNIARVESMSVFYPYDKRDVTLKLKNKLEDGQKIEIAFYERRIVNDFYEADKKPLIKKIVTLSN